jgi:hypothetical protein
MLFRVPGAPIIARLAWHGDPSGLSSVPVLPAAAPLSYQTPSVLEQPARFEKPRRTTALAQLRDPQFYRPGAGFPYPVATAVAPIDPPGAAFAGCGIGQFLDLQVHRPLGREADHPAQQVAIGALLQQRPEGHHLVGHRRVLRSKMTNPARGARSPAMGFARAALSSYTTCRDTTAGSGRSIGRPGCAERARAPPYTRIADRAFLPA